MLLAIAIVAAFIASGSFVFTTRRTGVLVASRDLDATTPLVAADVAIREFPLDAVPDGALEDVARAVGRVPRAPMVRGQLVLAASIAERGASFGSGLVPPRGTRAIALPAGPAQAIGGAITAGARVDVVAVPSLARPSPRPTELVAAGVLVLDVRTEAGQPLPRAGTRGALIQERLGSVVVAIPVQDELRVADRVGSSTFVFVLAGDAPARVER